MQCSNLFSTFVVVSEAERTAKSVVVESVNAGAAESVLMLMSEVALEAGFVTVVHVLLETPPERTVSCDTGRQRRSGKTYFRSW